MKQENFLKIAMLFVFVMSTHFSFGQTTVSYSFSDGGAVTGNNEAAPGITLDTNIGFGSFKNSGTVAPVLNSGQLRLYQNETKGGSIKIYASNGVTITDVVINASGTTGPAGYTIDGSAQINLSASDTYTISSINSTSEVEFFQRDANSSNRIYADSFSVTYSPSTPAPTVGFDAATSSETETQTTFTSATIPITVSNYSDTQIDINVTATLGTAEENDFEFTTPTALSFTANGSQNITLEINDDDDADDETITLTITETSTVTGLVISQATHNFTIKDNDAPTDWDGSESALWATAANWTNGVPGATNDVTIVNAGTAPIIGTSISAVVKNMTIAHTDGLTIDAGNLTIEGNLTIADGSNLTSNSVFTGPKTIDAATVILKGTYSSANDNQFIYNTETFNDNISGWTLVSSPTLGEEINGDEGFALFNQLQKNTGGDGTKYGIAPYDNSEEDPNDRWKYYTNNDFTAANLPGNQNIPMENGKGYSVLPNIDEVEQAKGKLRFRGDIVTGDVEIPITNNTEGSDNENPFNPFVGNAYNLIGNPFPSFIFVGTELGKSSFLITNTSAVEGIGDEATLWFWDKETTSYITVNRTSNRYIAPAQGFFVESKANGGTVLIRQSMLSHQAPSTFNKTVNTRPEIQLNMTNNRASKNTAIYYYDNKTVGFDSGYDSSMFGGVPSSLAVYTKLVATDDNRNLAIQTLPTSNYETMVIPVGVKAAKNSEITFSASALHLPEGFNLYLEDRVHNTVTRLDTENTEYKTTVIKNTTEGRFYLHTKTKAVLNTQTAILNTVSFFKTSNNNLKITGLQKGKTTVSLFNILGKNIMNTSFEASSVKNIALPNLASGVYIVKLQTEEGSLNKKIILE
jgi:hypothetical protein